MANKTGIIGGTFNPIHWGHLIAAEWVKEELNLDQVIFVPAGQPPHKNSEEILPENDRFNMVRLAIQDNAQFNLSDIEIKRAGKSYTIDTLKHFRHIYPQAGLYFILGLDAFLSLHTWKAVDELIDLAMFVVVTRPDYKVDFNDPIYNKLPSCWEDKVIHLEIPEISISSSMIRHRMSQGKSIKYLVPECVEKYINEFNLYGELYD